MHFCLVNHAFYFNEDFSEKVSLDHYCPVKVFMTTMLAL